MEKHAHDLPDDMDASSNTLPYGNDGDFTNAQTQELESPALGCKVQVSDEEDDDGYFSTDDEGINAEELEGYDALEWIRFIDYLHIRHYGKPATII